MVMPMTWTDEEVTQAVIARTRRVPLPEAVRGNGQAMTRQLDAALASAGFKLSRALAEDLSARETGQVLDISLQVLGAARKMAGDHVKHNPYFRDFPLNVPDTMGFWAGLLAEALLGQQVVTAAGGVTVGLGEAITTGQMVDIGGGELVEAGSLLSLPGYGKVQHTYEDMLAAHEALAGAATDRITLLFRGTDLDHEASELYLELAGSRVPLAEEDLQLLEGLARRCPGTVPERVPMRESRAVINQGRLDQGLDLLADTVTDVLRLLAVVSGGDVSLETPAKLRSLPRAARAGIMATLNRIVAANEGKLRDVPQYAEQWKRAGERLHPHEYPDLGSAQRVFAVARGEERATSMAGMAEWHLRYRRTVEAAGVLPPGMLVRSADRLLRAQGAERNSAGLVLQLVERAVPDVSARVLLSAREHFQNRRPAGKAPLPRIFANQKGRAWVSPDGRPGIDAGVLEDLLALLDEEVASRLPSGGRLIVDPAVLGAALPLSGKPAAPGLGVMPRGSVSDVVPGDNDVLTFFTYWRESKQRTDYDLSALMTDHEFGVSDHVSWQRYHSADSAVTYSGDITSAPDGATEFISCDLKRMNLPVIIPQVNIYSGEAFNDAAEAFFGFMTRTAAQKGNPFEAATVRMKSDLRGNGSVAMPLAFLRGEDGRWRAKWLHFYLKGAPAFNVAQGHKLTTSLLARTVLNRDYLQVRYLTALWGQRTADKISLPHRGGDTAAYFAGSVPKGQPVTYIGLERPDGLPDGTRVITLANLAELIPE
jgi:stress response protein SCP2